jgi:hypothetical protein
VSRSAAPAEVADKDHPELARIVLRQQRGQALADHIGLVARRHYGRHRGPPFRRASDPAIAFGRAPESASAQQQIEPNPERGQSYGETDRHPLHAQQ